MKLKIYFLIFFIIFLSSAFSADIFVLRLPEGTRTTINNVNLSSTVRNFKGRIQNETGIHSDNQILIFAGKALLNDRTLNDYNI